MSAGDPHSLYHVFTSTKGDLTQIQVVSHFYVNFMDENLQQTTDKVFVKVPIFPGLYGYCFKKKNILKKNVILM